MYSILGCPDGQQIAGQPARAVPPGGLGLGLAERRALADLLAREISRNALSPANPETF